MTREVPFDVLAERYASTPMIQIWSTRSKIVQERRFWVAALKAHKDLGLKITSDDIEAYERQIDNIDLDRITALELEMRHDVLARAHVFHDLAKRQLIHRAFTARDLTDNIEQFQILQSLYLVRDHTVAVLERLAKKAIQFQFLAMAGRSHNVAGQTTVLGKRFSNWAEELLVAFQHLEGLITTYGRSLRGIKGPMGTQQDILELLGSEERVNVFEQRMMNHLGFASVLTSVGQVYPRSLDFEVVSTLAHLSSAPGNMATTFRLMAGAGLLYEGFSEGQRGSTAMPHKINARTCERICTLVDVLGGFVHMTGSLVGNQWNEGDVSCSGLRRVALPGAFFAFDGLEEAALTVLDEMGVFEGAIQSELNANLALLSSSRLLLAMQDAGMGREEAHTILRDNATAAIKAGSPGTFIPRLLEDPRFTLNRGVVETLIQSPQHGTATQQVGNVAARVRGIVSRYPDGANYKPEPIR